MNTVNVSTRFSGFQLHLSHSPHLVPLMAPTNLPDNVWSAAPNAEDVVSQIQTDVMEAQDCLKQKYSKNIILTQTVVKNSIIKSLTKLCYQLVTVIQNIARKAISMQLNSSPGGMTPIGLSSPIQNLHLTHLNYWVVMDTSQHTMPPNSNSLSPMTLCYSLLKNLLTWAWSLHLMD